MNASKNTVSTLVRLALGLSMLAGAAQAQTVIPDPARNKGTLMGAPWKVGLATNAGMPVWDADLAAMARGLARGGTKMAFGFGTCYGGGMTQNLAALGAEVGGGAVTLTATSASRWNEPAFYPDGLVANRARPGLTAARPANDHYYDWVDSYVDSFAGAANAINAAENGWRHDPFGSNPTVDQGPTEVTRARENAQYRQTNAAARGFNHMMPAQANKYAILWSGQPEAPDRAQLVRQYNQLIAQGYAAANISVLVGAGAADGIAGMLPAGTLVQQATGVNLQGVFTGLAGLTAMDQLYFLANDHGTAWNANMPINRWVEMPKLPVYPSGSGGSSGSGTLPYDLENMPSGGDFVGYFGQYYVPTPGTLALFGTGVAAVARRRRN